MLRSESTSSLALGVYNYIHMRRQNSFIDYFTIILYATLKQFHRLLYNYFISICRFMFSYLTPAMKLKH